jgi:hypothetical protein
MSQQLHEAKSAVVTVGEGRGFVLSYKHNRFVVTAAQCLPFFPTRHGTSSLQERTYKTLLAPLGSEPTVCAECLFVDPIADIAVLGPPEQQELRAQAEAYEALLESANPFSIGDGPEQGHGWVLSLDSKWLRCTVQIRNDGSIWIPFTGPKILPRMSGSPIISDSYAAIGIVSYGRNPEGSKCPRLVRDLPGWFLHGQREIQP